MIASLSETVPPSLLHVVATFGEVVGGCLHSVHSPAATFGELVGRGPPSVLSPAASSVEAMVGISGISHRSKMV